MQVIQHEAESKVLETAKQHWEHSSSARCLYLRFSTLEKHEKKFIKAIIHEMDKFMDSKTTQLFLCHDYDVFVINRDTTHKRLTELFTHIRNRFTPAPLPVSSLHEGLATLYEINFEWPKLRDLFQRKIEDLELKIRRSKEAQAQNEAEAKIVQAEVHKQLVSTIGERRNKRKTTEVMVVDDDLFSQRLVKNTIGKKHAICTASDGLEAIKTYAAKAPDILFLDIGLPGADGHQVLKKIFDMDPGACVVMLSGNGSKENVMKAIQEGAKGFVGKPFTKDKLFHYIDRSPFIRAKTERTASHEHTNQ